MDDKDISPVMSRKDIIFLFSLTGLLANPTRKISSYDELIDEARGISEAAVEVLDE